MSRQPQLPPRPNQKRSALIHDPFNSNPCQDTNLCPRHHKSVSQSFILEQQPAWVDDLLSDSDSSFKGKLHRRAASDSGTLLDGLADFPCLAAIQDDKDLPSKEACPGLESACIYGPNSPRSKEKSTFPDNALVTALSDYASQSPMQYTDRDLFVSGIPQLDSIQDACGSAGEDSLEMKPMKRHSGQRSRVRKLQYIAELERTVHIFQTMESELAVRVDSLLRRRVYLSMENKELKQQIARLEQEKLILDRQYQLLGKEVELLKLRLPCSPDSRVSTYMRPNSVIETVSSEATWQMLDMGKLRIN